MPPEHQSWDFLYLLGWEDHSGRPFLTTWSGDLPWVSVIVYGVSAQRMPLWSAPVPPNARFEVVPDDQDGRELARLKGGFYAFGWYVSTGVDRKPVNPATG